MVGPVYVYATTSDGQPLVQAVGTEKQLQKLCEVLGVQQLIVDPLFQNNSLRVQNREALVGILAQAIARFTLEDVFRNLKKNGVPVARIRNMAQVMEDRLRRRWFWRR